jgi:hypothetical protein
LVVGLGAEELRREPVPQRPGREGGEDAFGARPIRLVEDDIEGDCRRAERGELPGRLGKPRARPGPLAELEQACLVDRDDADRAVMLERTRL